MNEKAKEWYDKGDKALKSEDYKECLRCWSIVYDIYIKDKNFTQAYLILSLIGSVNNSIENYKDALNCFQRALSIAKTHLDKKEIMNSLNDIGRAYLSLLQYDKARYYFHSSLKLAEKINDNKGKIDNYNEIGLTLMKENRIEESKGFFNLALNTARTIGNREQEADSLKFLGENFFELGQIEESIGYYLEALRIKDALHDRVGMLNIVNDIGNLYKNFNDQRKAWESYKRVFFILRDLDDKEIMPLTLTGIGDIYRQWHQDSEALELYKIVLDLSQETNELDIQWLALLSIGSIYQDIDRKNDAINCFSQAKDLAQKIGDKNLQLQTLLKIGWFYEEFSKYKKALKYYKKSLRLAKSSKDEKTKYLVCETMGLTFGSMNRYKKALKYLHKCLIYYQSKGLKIKQGDIYAHLSLCCAELKRYETALNLANKALIIDQEMGNKWKEAKDLENIGIILGLLLRDQEAIEYYKKSFSIMDELCSSAPSAALRISARKELQNILKYFISMLISLEESNTALAYLEQCKGREMLFDYDTHKEFPDFKEDINLLDQELQIISQELELIREQEQLGLLSEEEISLLRQNASEKRQIITKKRTILQLTHRFNIPTYNTLLLDDPIKLINDFKREMISGWIILDFFYNDKKEELMVFCLRKDHKTIVFCHKVKYWILNDLGILSTLLIELRRSNLLRSLILYKQLIQTLLKEQLYVNDYNNLVKMQNEITKGSFNNRYLKIKIRRLCLKVAENLLIYLKFKLYEILIPRQLKDFLKERDFMYLTVIPSGVLHSLPLELIYDGDEYWGLKYNITRAFNLHTLQTAIYFKQMMIPTSALIINATKEIIISRDEIFGGNDKTKYLFGRLKESANIVKELRPLFEENGYEFKLLEDMQINKNDIINILKDCKFSLIHYAGHAFFNTTNPNLSFLLLQENQGPMKIYANEIPAKTKLNGHPLIVLIACETGGVEVQTGDEVFGLARGFIEAGATGLLVTGWPITDKTAADFTKFFYEYYVDKISLAKAVRLARKKVYSCAMKSYKGEELHYFDNEVVDLHWAPFRVYGLPYY